MLLMQLVLRQHSIRGNEGKSPQSRHISSEHPKPYKITDTLSVSTPFTTIIYIQISYLYGVRSRKSYFDICEAFPV